MAAPAKRRRFKQVDVFTGVAFKGNPLAIVLDAEGLTAEQMLAIARWTNLSETTFVLAPTTLDADYRVRIFSSGGELPFAGHPTLGTAHALLEHGLVPHTAGRLVQECGIGLVPVEFGAGATLSFRAPPVTFDALHENALPALAAALPGGGIDSATPALIARMGIAWLLVRMRSAEACLALQPRLAPMTELLHGGVTGIAAYGPHPTGGVSDIEVRAFFAKGDAIAEDPVTGSANACIAWALRGACANGYGARQGTRLGCDGRVAVSYRDDVPWIGGQCVTIVDGTLMA